MAGAGDPGHGKMSRREVATRRARVVKLVRKLPEATATEHGTHLSLEERGRRFAWYLENHHDNGRVAVNCKAPPGADRMLGAAASGMFHVPKHLGHRGWVGLWLDLPRTDWSEVEAALADAYRMTAPESLVARLGRR